MRLFTSLSVFLLALLSFGLIPAQAQTISFNPSGLIGENVNNPTSLQFGPDGRLYVVEQSGRIFAYTIVRNGPSDYQVTNTEQINIIRDEIPNYNDDGSFFEIDNRRQATGIYVRGTATNPILYVSSSDWRNGGGANSADTNLDTNSSMLSRLTWNSTTNEWDHVQLIRGLPRSEENHSTNGMQIDEATNTMYLISSGSTNAGAPSNNFAFLTEYAYAAAILEIDLDVLESMPILTETVMGQEIQYVLNMPTLDDPTRPNVNGIIDPNASGYDGIDVNDPFGGNDGLNQAKYDPTLPISIYSVGWRNAYDIVLTEAGRLYSIDNGANQDWGGYPELEGTAECTNNWINGEPGSSGPGPAPNFEDQVNNLDNLHYISGPGYYAGHPIPIRGNPDGAFLFTHSTFGSGFDGILRDEILDVTDPDFETLSLPVDWPPYPNSLADPRECDFLMPGVEDGALATWNASTNGIAEYTASNFGGQLTGDLLMASFNGTVYRFELNAAGDDGTLFSFASGFGATPLDVIAQGDDDLFPGTVWAATYGADNITVFEPADYDGGTFECVGNYDNTIDEDNDGYTNADEIDNGTDPCSGASLPDDNDQTDDGSGFLVSDLNDPDDDNDGLLDTYDPYQIDAINGANTGIPVNLELLNGEPGYGFYGLGFTGLMTNGTPALPGDDYLNLYADANIIAGGTAGLLTMLGDDGTALNASNDLMYGFQFGLNNAPINQPYTIEVTLSAPFFASSAGTASEKYEGFYIGDGTQDNYLALVVDANGSIRVIHEEDGVSVSGSSQTFATGINLASAASITLYMNVNPNTGIVEPAYAVNAGTVTSVGGGITVGGTIEDVLDGTHAVSGVPVSMAIGVMVTSATTQDFNATWDEINIYYSTLTSVGNWELISDSTGAPDARHESGFIEVGGLMYLLGGRGVDPVNIYNPTTNTWTNGAAPPVQMHHIQPVEIDGLIYVVAGYGGGCCTSEFGLDHVYIYDPVADQWYQGAEIPVARRRGSVGAVVYNNQIYIAGGLDGGHGITATSFDFFDRYDPTTNTWEVLADAPRARDHFSAVVIDDNLYLAGGRQTDILDFFANTISEVDVYNFTTNTWSTLPSGSNIPTERAGTLAAAIDNEVIVVGGESGQSQAHAETEALNVTNGTWRTLDVLNEDRHSGGMAICNDTLYAVAGSGAQGGNPELASAERFSFFGPTVCPINPYSAGTLVGNPTSLNFGSVADTATSTLTVTLSNTGGDQALLLTNAVLTTGTEFSFVIPYTLPVVIPPGETMDVDVTFAPATADGSSDTLTFTSSTGANLNISLSGNDGTVSNDPIYRVNAGGAEIVDTPINWAEDDPTQTYSTDGNDYAGGPLVNNTTSAPDGIFGKERYGDQEWDFPVTNGTYTVRFYFMEGFNGSEADDARLFDIEIEGVIPPEFDNFDIYEEAGFAGDVGIVREYAFDVVDGNIDINFITVADNAAIRGIEIIPAISGPSPSDLVTRDGLTPITEVDFGAVVETTTSTPFTVTLDNTGTADPIVISNIEITGTDASAFSVTPTTGTTLDTSDLYDLSIEFTPPSVGSFSAVLEITHDGNNGPVTTLDLVGEGTVELSTTAIRINVGGPQVVSADASTPDWGEDTAANPSPYRVTNGGADIYNGSSGNAHPGSIVMTHPSLSTVPYAPATIFNTERWDRTSNPEMGWEFDNIPVGAEIVVRLYFAELFSGVDLVGERIFDVEIEGVVPAVFDDIDAIAVAGPKGAFMLEYQVIVTDGTLDIDFLHGVANNPSVKGIEIFEASSGPNNAPTIDPIVDQSVAENTSLIVPVFASDLDGDPLTIDVEVLDDTLATVDAGTFVYSYDAFLDEITFAPVSGTAGEYTVNVTADDGTDTATETFTLTVGLAPSALVQINPTGTIGANSSDTASFTIENTGSIPIASATIDLSTTMLQNLVFDPTGNAGDALSKCLTPDAGEAETGYITPAGGNCAVFAAANAGLPFSAENNNGYNLLGLTFATDEFAEGETFAFSVDIDPTSMQGSTDVDDTAGAISGLEIIGATVTIEFQDGTTYVTELYTIPTTNPSASQTHSLATVPTETVTLDVEGVVLVDGAADLSYADPTLLVTGPANATVSITQLNTGIALTGLDQCGVPLSPYESNNANNVTEYTVTLDGAGEGDVLVTLFGIAGVPETGFNYFTAVVVDDTETPRLTGSLSNTVVLTYPEYPNFVPELISTYTDQSMDEGDLLSLPLEGCDPASTAPSFVVTVMEQGTVTPETFFTVNDNLDGTGTVDFEPTFLDAGIYDVMITATDGSLSSPAASFVLTVNNVNAPPVIDPIAEQTVALGDTIDIDVNASDDDGETPDLSVAIAGVSDAGAFSYSFIDNNDGTGTMTVTPLAGTTPGTYVVTVTADDGTDQTTLDFDLVVTANGAPVIDPIVDQSVQEGTSLVVNINVTDTEAVTIGVQVWDNLANVISPVGTFYTAVDNTDGTGTITFTPQVGDAAGSLYDVTVTAVDTFSNLTTETFQVDVTSIPVNNPPVVDPIADQSSVTGTAASLQVNATDTDTLTYGATGLPAGLTINTATGLISGTVSATANVYPVTVSVSDSVNTAVEVNFDWTVTDLPGVISFTLVDADLDVPVAGYDPIPEGAVLNLATLPESLNIIANTNPNPLAGGVFFNLNSGALTRQENVAPYALGGDNSGNYNVTVIPLGANTLTGSSTSGSVFTLNFTVINDFGNLPPTADAGPSFIQVTDEDVSGSETVTLNGSGSTDDVGVTSYVWTNEASTVIGNTASINVTVPVNTSQVFTLTVFDVEGESDSDTITVIVDAVIQDESPIVEDIDDQVNRVGDAVSLQVQATDFETLTYGATGLPAGLTINTATGLISGTITATPNNYLVTVSVSDGVNAPVNVIFTWTVNPELQGVTGFTLIDANLNTPVVGYDPIPEGAVLNLATLPTNLNIRANTNPNPIAGGVFLNLNSGEIARQENVAPYALGGDNSGNYNSTAISLGSNTLTGTTTEGVFTLNFTVVNE